MKKIRFHVSTGVVGSGRYEVVEFPDEATDAEIDEEFQAWVWEQIDAGYWPEDEDE